LDTAGKKTRKQNRMTAAGEEQFRKKTEDMACACTDWI
jgi:hypothetical protein